MRLFVASLRLGSINDQTGVRAEAGRMQQPSVQGAMRMQYRCVGRHIGCLERETGWGAKTKTGAHCQCRNTIGDRLADNGSRGLRLLGAVTGRCQKRQNPGQSSRPSACCSRKKADRHDDLKVCTVLHRRRTSARMLGCERRDPVDAASHHRIAAGASDAP